MTSQVGDTSTRATDAAKMQRLNSDGSVLRLAGLQQAANADVEVLAQHGDETVHFAFGQAKPLGQQAPGVAQHLGMREVPLARNGNLDYSCGAETTGADGMIRTRET